MKKLLIILALFQIALISEAKTYYDLVFAFGNGAIQLSNGGTTDISVSNSEVSWTFNNGMGVRVPFKKIDSKGNRVYRSSSNEFGQYSIITLTPDYNNMVITVMYGNDWAASRWLTSSKSIQKNFISNNQHLNSKGIDFRALYEQSSIHPDKNRSTAKSCTVCNGSKVDPSPNEGGSLNNWVAYYNSAGSNCPYCKRSSKHFHDRCSHCNIPVH